MSGFRKFLKIFYTKIHFVCIIHTLLLKKEFSLSQLFCTHFLHRALLYASLVVFRCCTPLCFQHCPLVSMDSELEIVPGRATPASPAAEQLLPVSAGAGLPHVLLYNLTPPLLFYS